MSEKLYKHEMPYDDGWKKLSGPLPVNMTSDYLFRALLQSDEKTLIAMVCDLLHMKPEEITYIEVTNPIVIGGAKMFKSKTWEEMHMLASQDKEIEQAASSMWQLTEDRKVREQIRRREANINAYNRKEKMLADLKEQLEKKDYQLKEKDDMLEIQGKKLEEKDRLIDELRKKLDKIEA